MGILECNINVKSATSANEMAFGTQTLVLAGKMGTGRSTPKHGSQQVETGRNGARNNPRHTAKQVATVCFGCHSETISKQILFPSVATNRATRPQQNSATVSSSLYLT